MHPKYQPRFNGKLKLLLLTFLVTILIIVAKYFRIQEVLQQLLIWVHSLGVLGPIAYIVIYNLATLLFIPGSILTLKGGCLFGVFWGSVYVFIAAIIGATLAFIIGRYLTRDWISRQMDKHPKFKAINLAVAKEGWKLVLLTRLSPIFPFNLLNYAFGVTQVSIKDYILGSLGIFPGTVMYVYIGSLATNLATIDIPHQPSSPEAQIWQWVMQAVGLIATVGVTVYVTRIAQKSLQQNVFVGESSNEKANSD